MKCSDCAYFWPDVDERTGEPTSTAYCHYGYDDGYAPCEEEFDETHIPHDERD